MFNEHLLKLFSYSKWVLFEGQQTVTSVESAANEIELRLQRRRERERARHQSESAEQRKEQLSRWWVKDRARRAAQTAKKRELGLQQRCDRLNSETAEQRIIDVLCAYFVLIRASHYFFGNIK